MFGHKKRKIRILCLKFRIFIAVTIHCDNTVGIFRYNCALRVHTEGTYKIFEFLCSVYNLTLIEFIRQIRKYNGRQFNTDTNIHTIGFRWNIHLLTNGLHPLTAASSNGNNAPFAKIALIRSMNAIALAFFCHMLHSTVEKEIHSVFQLRKKLLQHNIIHIRAKVSDRSIQQMQVILDANLLKLCIAG